jgi:TonB family protein
MENEEMLPEMRQSKNALHHLRRLGRWLFVSVTVTVCCVHSAAAQAPGDWRSRLVGKPLYLRGFYADDKLEFDASGKLIGTSILGPVTLSGVDVDEVEDKRQTLVLHGNRVALMARGDGSQGLERQVIASTTRIWPSLRRGDKNKFHASEKLTITIHPDPHGNFETAIKAIFADGVADLASSVPPYWKCYADSYFLPATVANNAVDKVNACVSADGAAIQGTDNVPAVPVKGPVIAPVMTVSKSPAYTDIARELGLAGTCVVHIRIRTDGVPVGLQIVRAIGGGLDEEALQAASEERFKPATLDGLAVPVNANIEVHFELKRR